jgi:hypothetical protein
MVINEDISVTGKIGIIVTDKDCNIKETRNVNNLVVTTGKHHIAARIAGALSGAGLEGSIISHIGFGTGTSTPLLLNTDIDSLLGTRIPISSIVHLAGTNTILVTASFTGYAGNITETGMFNSITGGTMVCRTTFSPVPILSTDGLAIIWTLTIN